MSKWSAFGHILKTVLPLAIALSNPKLAPLAETISNGADEAELLFGPGSGADKLAHVQKLAHSTAIGINQGFGKEVVPIDGLDDAVASSLGTAIKITNILHTESK